MGNPDSGAAESSEPRVDNPSNWIRWTDGQDNLHVHKVCRMGPPITFQRSFPFVSLWPNEETAVSGESRPLRTREFRDPDTGEPREFVFIGGVARLVLKYTPFVILLATVVLFGTAELSPQVDGISALFPDPNEWMHFFGLWLAPWPFLIWLLYKADVVGGGETSIATLASLYGFPFLLSLGVLASLILVFVEPEPHAIDRNVVFVSGYLLTLLIGGQLLYETVLRTEHLFVNLPKGETSDIVKDEAEYRRFLADLSDSLETRVFGIRAATLFGVLFAFQFAVMWGVGEGPQHLDYHLNVAINTLLNVVLVIATYQLIVLTTYTNKLFSDDGEYRNVLGYEPFHVDGYGGYRDLGRFALRFNILIGLGGLYLVYRLYVQGTRALPADGIVGFEEQIEFLIWAVNFVAPVLIYGIVLVVWIYFSFWGMHAKMVREKDILLRKYQGSPHTEGTAGAGVPVESFEGGPAWEDVKHSPEWPLEPSRLKGVVTGTFIPLLLPLPELLLF